MNTTTETGIPILHTQRLRLAGWRQAHLDAFARLHADPGTMRHIGDGRPLDAVGAWLHMAMLMGHWQLRGYGVWAIEEPETGALAGRTGLFHPEGWDEAELNWMIVPALRGRGLAVEAAAAAREHAFGVLGLPGLVSLIRPGNEASRRVAARLGATLERSIDFLGSPMQVYRHHRPA